MNNEPSGINWNKPTIGPSPGGGTNGTPYPKQERPLQEVAQEKADQESMPTRKKNPAVQS